MSAIEQVPDFLESLYALCERGENRASARLALRTTNALLSGGHFDTMDAHFETLDAGRLGLDAIVALLILTRFEHDRMPARERFYEAAIEHVRENGGEAAVLEAKHFYR